MDGPDQSPMAAPRHKTLLAPGALIELPGFALTVVDVGLRQHSLGFGDSDFRGYADSALLSAGTLVNTPWGQCEIIQRPTLAVNK